MRVNLNYNYLQNSRGIVNYEIENLVTGVYQILKIKCECKFIFDANRMTMNDQRRNASKV